MRMISVVNNLPAMFTDRQLKINDRAKAKSMEKLSSGYRINRAGDDAAGLAISEKLRRLIRGLDKGSENIQEGISLIQTAEGALNEVHDMLQRMNELAVKGLNGTLTNDDRQTVQEEIDQLYDEISRTADATTYNEINVLKGNPEVMHMARQERTRIVKSVSAAPGEMPTNLVSFSSTSMTLGGAGRPTQPVYDGTSIKAVPKTDENGNEITRTIRTGPNTTSVETVQEIVTNSAWSTTLSDNFGAYLDFSALSQVSGARTVVNDGNPVVIGSNYEEALSSFLWTGFYSTCNTCDEQYSVVFVDGSSDCVFRADKAYKDGNFDPNWGRAIEVNLKDLLEEAKEVTTPAEAQEATKKLVKLIAETVSNDSKVKGHYTRYKTDDTDPYKLFVYDFRDYTTNVNSPTYGYITSPPQTNVGQGQLGNLQGKLYRDNVELYVENIPYVSEDPLRIQHGNEVDNFSNIDLPDLNSIFNVYEKYGYPSAKSSLTLIEKIPAKEYAAAGTYTYETRTVVTPAHYEDEYDSKFEDVIENGEVVGRRWVQIYKGQKYVEEKTTTYQDAIYHPGPQMYEPESWGELNEGILDVIKDMIGEVSKMRTDLGAMQNRLEHAYNYNQIAAENMTDAESQIRDTNMAAEMVKNANQSIIQQAAQSMLAQANQSNQGVLNLLG